MSELVILSKKEVEKMFREFLEEIRAIKNEVSDYSEGDKMNQKDAAHYLGVSQATLIRWKKEGRVPCDQLPGSTKVTYYKSQLKLVFQRNSEVLRSSNLSKS